MLSFPHPDYLLPYLTAGQLDEWLAWMRETQPFPGRFDRHWALLLAMTHNAWCDPSDALRPQDFMLYQDRFDEEITAEDLAARLGLL